MSLTTDFEITDFDGAGDPYALFSRARGIGPVVRTPAGFVLAVGYHAALDVLRHPAATSGPIGQRYLAALPPGAARDEMSHRINFLDPPDHPRVRGLVAKAFTPRRIADLRGFAEATARGLLADLAVRDEFDVLSEFAHQVPSLVISEMLGVPPEDRDQLTRWSDDVTPLLGFQIGEHERSAALSASEHFSAYLDRLIETRRSRPGPDLLSALVEAEEAGQRLSHPELLSLAMTLYSAGHRTTRDLFTNGLSVLLERPDLVASVVDGSLPVTAVVLEFLRYETPTLFVARFPAEPIVVGGVEIRPLEPVLVALASANRDPAEFPHPDEFDPARFAPPDPHPGFGPLSFAFGAHYCLGASLARMEAEVMLETLVERLPGATPAGHALEWRQRGPFRSLAAYRIRP